MIFSFWENLIKLKAGKRMPRGDASLSYKYGLYAGNLHAAAAVVVAVAAVGI